MAATIACGANSASSGAVPRAKPPLLAATREHNYSRTPETKADVERYLGGVLAPITQATEATQAMVQQLSTTLAIGVWHR